MATITFTPSQIGARLRADHKGIPAVIRRAMFSGAQRGKAWIVGKSPVDRGILRNAWKVMKLSEGVELVNDQPYAGVLERGARPFKISKAGREALAGWVFRKILQGTIAVKTAGKVSTKGISRGDVGTLATRKFKQATHQAEVRGILEKEADRIAWAIAKKWEKVGMRGKRFVWLQLTTLAKLMDKEVDRYLTKFFNRRSGSE